MAGLTDRILVVIDATSSGATKELDQLQKSAKKSGDSFDTLGKRAGLAGSTIKAGLVAGAAALVGTGLVKFLGDSVDAFGDAAKAAGELAQATGGTVDEVSRMQAALKGAGIGAEQSAALMTKFTTNAGKNADLLDKLGVSLKKNADGSIDYADGMVQAVDAINKMGNASQRNQALVALFGKAGASAFNELASSGISLSESMRLVNQYQVFTADDVERAKRYDDAMDNLGASVQGLQFAIGGALVPALSAAADAFSDVLNFVMNIPGPMKELAVEAGLAAVGLLGIRKALVFIKSEQAGLLFVTMLDGVAKLVGAFVGVEGSAGKAGVAIRGVGLALKSMLVSAGPFVALFAIIDAGLNAISAPRRTADSLLGSINDVTASLADQATQLAHTDSVWDSIVSWELPIIGSSEQEAAIERVTTAYEDMAAATLEAADSSQVERAAAQSLLDVIHAGNLGTDEGTAAMKAYAEAVGASAAAAAELQAKQTELNDLIAQGVTGGQEFADAATAAAAAQRESKTASDLAAAAMLAYDTSIQGAIDRLLQLNDTSLEGAKEQLENLSFEQVGSKWVDEADKAAKDATTIILREFAKASEEAPGLDPVKWLQTFREGAPPEIQKVIDGLIATFEAMPAEARVTAALDPVTAGQTKTDLEGVAADQDAVVNVTSVGADVVRGQLDSLDDWRETRLTVSLAGDDEVRRRLDSLDDWREMRLTMDLDKDYEVEQRLNQLDDWRTTRLTVDLVGDEEAMRTLDRLDDWRTVRITVQTVGVNAARSALNSVTANSAAIMAAAPQIQQRIVLPPAPAPVPAINMVRVSVDGRELRAVVRDEIRAAMPAPAGVA